MEIVTLVAGALSSAAADLSPLEWGYLSLLFALLGVCVACEVWARLHPPPNLVRRAEREAAAARDGGAS